MKTKLYMKIISFILVLTMLFSLVACSSTPEDPSASNPPSWTNPTLSDPNEKVETEDIETEDIITETVFTEFITTEIYVKEIIEVEDKVTELLLQEEMINEVQLCKTIYVPQDHIEEFSENSQTKELFGEGIDFGALATKIAVGTGIIITLVVLSKVGLPEPVASVIIGAASGSMKFAATGAAIGSLYGGLTGATDEIDETGRTSAIIGVSVATVSLILSIVGLVAAIPSGGASIGVAEGIKIGIAAVSVVAATAGTTVSTVNAVKTFKATDATDIDWNNIDWDRVGVSAAEQAINNAADGYMWGSIAGAVYGGAEGYANYHKHSAPYSSLEARMKHVPAENSPKGRWSGARGESDFILNEPITLPDGTVVTKVTYKNAVPDFSPYQQAQVKITGMTDTRYGTNGNFTKADEALAKAWTQSKHNGKTWTARDVANYRETNNLTWHEMSNMEYMQLVPTDVNASFAHTGGCSEYRTMIGQTGGSDFD